MDTGLARAVIGGPFLFETQTLTLDHQKSVEIGRNKRGDESHFELKEGREKKPFGYKFLLSPPVAFSVTQRNSMFSAAPAQGGPIGGTAFAVANLVATVAAKIQEEFREGPAKKRPRVRCPWC